MIGTSDRVSETLGREMRASDRPLLQLFEIYDCATRFIRQLDRCATSAAWERVFGGREDSMHAQYRGRQRGSIPNPDVHETPRLVYALLPHNGLR